MRLRRVGDVSEPLFFSVNPKSVCFQATHTHTGTTQYDEISAHKVENNGFLGLMSSIKTIMILFEVNGRRNSS